MKKVYSLLLLLFVSTSFVYGQRYGDYYISIAVDSVQGGRLKFLNDTTVELSSIPRHMSPSFIAIHKYTSTDTAIEIFPIPIRTNLLKSTGPQAVHQTSLTKIQLRKIHGGFIDNNKSLIYVREKDFGRNPDIAYIINGKTYIQDMGITDSYGLLRKRPRTNKALQKRLKEINKGNCTIEIVRGLNAYKRYGIKRVYGAIVITTQK